MNRPVTAVFAALESLLVVAIGVGVPVVALTFLWAFQYGLQIDWVVFWRIGVDTWLVGHGADLTVTLSAASAKATGLDGAGDPIVLSIAALGFGLATFLLGARAGRRLAETEHRVVGSVAAIASFAVYSLILTATASTGAASIPLVQGAVFPTLFLAIPLLLAVEVNRRRRGQEPGVFVGVALRGFAEVPRVVRVVAVWSVRAGLGAAVILFSAAGVLVAILLASHYASVVSLYESAHGGVLGGLALTLGQIALLPNVLAWAASWLIGPGFAIGAGSSVSPLGTTLGPMPSIPFLGALPSSTPTFAFVGLLVPVVSAFVVATLLRPNLSRQLGADDTTLARVAAGASVGVTAGIVVAIAAALSSGSAGPGRLAEVGPKGLLVGALAALEIGVPAMLALVVRQPDGGLGAAATSVASKLGAAGGPAAGETAQPVPAPRSKTASGSGEKAAPARDTATPKKQPLTTVPPKTEPAATKPPKTVPATTETRTTETPSTEPLKGTDERPSEVDHEELTRGLPSLSEALGGDARDAARD